jgi:hypothetical protein
MSGLRLIFGNRAAVVRKRAEQASASFAILSRSRSAGRTADGERLFWPELCHGENDNASTLKSRVVNFDQMLLTAHFGACSSLACAQNSELVQSFPYPHISDPTAEGLPWIVPATRRSLAPLVKTRGFGKTNAIGARLLLVVRTHLVGIDGLPRGRHDHRREIALRREFAEVG